MAALLELRDVDARYGPVKALHGVTLTVGEGEIVALLGANGAGKTTTLRAVSGMVRRGGVVSFAGRQLRREGPEAVARLGIAHVPEGRGTFSELTVWENLRLGAFTRRGSHDDDVKRVLSFFPWLDDRRLQQAGTLSGGEQQMLALGRAMMQRPRLLMIDEPSLGLAPLIVAEIFRILQNLNASEGTTILLVEQNARNSLAVSNRAYLLETGRVVLSGDSDELAQHEGVRRSYLGY
jgi:branched-chain amino acid transport system ATP-binding protein